jgi:rhombotail lipoprotein
MNHTRCLQFLVVGILISISMAGCAGRKDHYKSSVVEYLYPKTEVVEHPTIPRLSLPLHAGVAFVPASGDSKLSEKDKLDLMSRISAEFRKLAFIKDIEMIPSNYLTTAGGFTNLDQIRTMYNIDVVALLAYDQVQHTDEGLLSLTYWTIVGAYLVQGEKNDTSTMIDATVYDIASRKMLFRAPGTSQIKGSATFVNQSEQLRRDSLEGFRTASENLIVNLQTQLELFKVKVKEKPQEYAVENKPGYTGGGSVGAIFSLFLLGLAGVALWRTRKV